MPNKPSSRDFSQQRDATACKELNHTTVFHVKRETYLILKIIRNTCDLRKITTDTTGFQHVQNFSKQITCKRLQLRNHEFGPSVPCTGCGKKVRHPRIRQTTTK